MANHSEEAYPAPYSTPPVPRPTPPVFEGSFPLGSEEWRNAVIGEPLAGQYGVVTLRWGNRDRTYVDAGLDGRVWSYSRSELEALGNGDAAEGLVIVAGYLLDTHIPPEARIKPFYDVLYPR